MAVEIIAIITPKAGKADRIAELLGAHAKWVEANEPKTLKYELKRETNKKTGVEELIMVEAYEDMAAIQAHSAAPQFKAFGKKLKEEDLTEGAMQVKFIKHVAGFSRL